MPFRAIPLEVGNKLAQAYGFKSIHDRITRLLRSDLLRHGRGAVELLKPWTTPRQFALLSRLHSGNQLTPLRFVARLFNMRLVGREESFMHVKRISYCLGPRVSGSVLRIIWGRVLVRFD